MSNNNIRMRKWEKQVENKPTYIKVIVYSLQGTRIFFGIGLYLVFNIPLYLIITILSLPLAILYYYFPTKFLRGILLSLNTIIITSLYITAKISGTDDEEKTYLEFLTESLKEHTEELDRKLNQKI